MPCVQCVTQAFQMWQIHQNEPKQRLNFAKQLKLCFNCLQLFTKAHTCSKQLCRQCHKRHLILLHIDKQNQTTNDKGSTTNNNHSAKAKGTTTAEVNAYCSLTSTPRNHILLATAIVDVKNKSVPCRALLNSGSQSHFITERCVQRLKLSRTQTHAFIQGISNVNTATHHSVSIHLRSRHTDWHTTLDCAILSSITGTTPPSKLDISSWKIPKDIKLADEHFDQPGSIDLLIGADLFYEMLQSGRRKRPETSQYYKKQFWAGQFLVERQTQIRMYHNLHNCHEKTTAWIPT